MVPNRTKRLIYTKYHQDSRFYCKNIRSYFDPHFPVSLRIQSECGKMRTRITPNCHLSLWHPTTFVSSVSEMFFEKKVFDKWYSKSIQENTHVKATLLKLFFMSALLEICWMIETTSDLGFHALLWYHNISKSKVLKAFILALVLVWLFGFGLP